MRLILFTATNCPRCPAAKSLVEEITKELGMENEKDYKILNIDDEENMILALQHQIASTPSIVIDDEPIFVGKVPTKEELIEKLKS